MSATGKNGKKNAERVVTPMEALQLLESAVNYCQKAGLTIHAGNVPYLCVSIEQATLEGSPPRFVMTAERVTSPAESE